MVNIVLNLLIIGLLAATIVYCWMLNKRLSTLRADRMDMAKLLGEFADATTKADNAIRGLKRTADENGTQLDERIKQAMAMREDLGFLVERAEKLAGALEVGIRNNRNNGMGLESAVKMPQRSGESEVEQQLRESLKAML